MAAQQPAPTPSPRLPDKPPIEFAVDVGYVEVDAIVTDRKGNSIRDLKPSDFTVSEDGKPQKIELFTLIDIPYETPEKEPRAPVVELDVRSNARAFDGRVYVIVLDELHTAALRSSLVKKSMRQFVERYFGDNDVAAVVYTTGRRDAGQELTSSRRLLLESIDKFMGRKLRSATLNKIDEYQRTRDIRQQGDPINDLEAMERGHNARIALDTLKSAADWLGSIRGRRKALVYVSEGIDYDVTDPFNNKDATTVLDGMREAISAAEGANTSIYAIDPRGLHSMGDEMMEMQVIQDTSLGLDSRGLQSEMRLSQDSLRTLAEETRGHAAVARNDFGGAFERIVKDNSSYYVLGYHPANQKRDGRFRKLQVKVSRPGVEVRARSGYRLQQRGRPSDMRPTWASAETPTPLVQLLKSPVPKSGLLLSVQAAPFRDKAQQASVMLVVQTDGKGFRFEEVDGQSRDTLELSVTATDAGGKSTGLNQSMPMNLRPQTRKAMDLVGFRVISRLDLKPGQYQIRVAGRAVNSGITGSVFYDVEVPDFSKPDVAISGLVITSAIARLAPTAGSFEPLKDILPAPPTTWRDFSVLDTILLVAEIYDNAGAVSHSVDIRTTVRGEGGATVFRKEEQRSTDELKEAGGLGFVHKAEIPLKELAPGDYTLHVLAQSRMGKQPQAERQLRFRVWPSPEARPPGGE